MKNYEEFIGQVLDRRYEIKEILGEGGMSVVFLADDLLRRRPVALKLLREEFERDEINLARFTNEAKAVAMLSHENIVNIYDTSLYSDLKYIVMEYVEGETLRDRIDREGALPFSDILSVTSQILLALDYAHARGIVHCDIKPQNILLLSDGKVKLADFGIATIRGKSAVKEQDKTIGTVYYMSPEQASGKKTDQKSDLYSLGAMVYEMATGTLPFDSDSTVSIVMMHMKETPMTPSKREVTVPPALDAFILTAMEKHPKDRFSSASQMLEYLRLVARKPKKTFDIYRDEKSERASGGKMMMPIILGVFSAFLIALLVAGIYLFDLLFLSRSDVYVMSVPDCIGEIVDAEFLEKLEKSRYSVTVNEIYDASVLQGSVISQSPAPGEERRVVGKQQTVKLTLNISLGSRRLTVGDYTMKEARQTVIDLRRAGYVVQEIKENNPHIPYGYIIRSTPAPGTEIDEKEPVVLYVSSGVDIKYQKVPSFVGKNEAETYNTLLSLGLKVGNVSYIKSREPAGTVLSQNIAPDTEVALPNTKISFVISGGPNYRG